MTAEEEISAWINQTPPPERIEPDWIVRVAPARVWTPDRRPPRPRSAYRTRRWEALVAVGALASSALGALLALR